MAASHVVNMKHCTYVQIAEELSESREVELHMELGSRARTNQTVKIRLVLTQHVSSGMCFLAKEKNL